LAAFYFPLFVAVAVAIAVAVFCGPQSRAAGSVTGVVTEREEVDGA
jgi:hypothetical protein